MTIPIASQPPAAPDGGTAANPALAGVQIPTCIVASPFEQVKNVLVAPSTLKLVPRAISRR